MSYRSAKKETISSTHSLPSSPEKNPFTSQTTSKNTFLFYVNCSFEACRCFWRIRLPVLLISKFPSGSQRMLPSSSQMNTSESCIGFGNMTWVMPFMKQHLAPAPSLPDCELPAQGVLGKWNGLTNCPRRAGDWRTGEVQAIWVFLAIEPCGKNGISLPCFPTLRITRPAHWEVMRQTCRGLGCLSPVSEPGLASSDWSSPSRSSRAANSRSCLSTCQTSRAPNF